MSVLFTGNLSNLSLEFYNRITPTEKCVLFFDKDAKHYREKNLVTYVKNKNVEDDIMHIFSTFDFSTVVYVSSTIDGNIKVFNELEHLESILYACRKYKVSHFIYITSNDLIGYDSDKVDLVSRAALMSACENMCKEFALERICHFKIIKIPYLYNLKENNNRLTHYIERAIVKGKIIFRGTKNKQIDFLCDEDLGKLIDGCS